MSYVSCFFLGLVLSFLGQLPLGTLSMTATQIAIQENFRNAWKYIIGVALIEMIYLRVVLSGMHWIFDHSMIFKIFNWITVLFFLIFGALSFRTAIKQDKEKKALLLDNEMNRFFLGVIMSAFNPAQIPFWFIWSGYFLSQGWLISGWAYFNVFTIGAAMGTLLGLMVYMYGGHWLVKKMNTTHRRLNQIMGIVFIIAALAQLYRIIYP